ncbi:MAG: hypothetical protein KGJ59_00645 [Bacteroidota bacterium]|nr:hypothetical protein [Bacteroidota bacterium]
MITKLSVILFLLMPFTAIAGGSVPQGTIDSSYSGKCLTPLLVYLRTHPSHGLQLERIAVGGRPDLETSIVSHSGKFRIHFDTSATSDSLPAMVDQNGNRIANSAKQYADTVATIFDSVWNTEIGLFGFPAPPSDNGVDGNEFDVYILDLGANNFGETGFDDVPPINPSDTIPRFPAWIKIDNDFGIGFRTKGVAAIEVTAAHEFFHAIQVGIGVWYNDFQYYEMTAESMESRVFPAVKDYVFDIGQYFQYIESTPLYLASSPQTPGYERAIWAIFLMEQHGIQIMRTWWSDIASQRPWFAMEQAISANNSSVASEFTQFSQWNFYTNFRADTVQYYPDARLFPLVHIEDSQPVAGGSYTFAGASQSYVPHYFLATINADSTFFIVSNVNTDDARSETHSTFGFSLSASGLNGTLSYSFSAPDPANWKVSAVGESTPSGGMAEGPFPDPFYPTRGALLFPVSSDPSNAPSIFIFTSSFSLVNEIQSPVVTVVGKRYVSWDGRDKKGRLVSSGIYFYVVSGKSGQQKGKFAVLR